MELASPGWMFLQVLTLTNAPTWQQSHGTDASSRILQLLFSILVHSVPSTICPILPFKHFLWDSCCVCKLSFSAAHTHMPTLVHVHPHIFWWLHGEVSCLWRVGFLVPVQKCVTRDTHGLLEAGILSLMGPAAVGTTWGYGRRGGWMGED